MEEIPSSSGWGRGRCPVINVSWNDAKEYTEWLSKKAGKPFRLLTEAEWEYAARAGTTTAFSTGATITTDQANFNRSEPNAGGSANGTYLAKTVSVGSYKPNAFGLYDMHGNVSERVEASCGDAAGRPKKRPAPFMLSAAAAQSLNKGGARDHGGGCLGRHMGFDSRHQLRRAKHNNVLILLSFTHFTFFSSLGRVQGEALAAM